MFYSKFNLSTHCKGGKYISRLVSVRQLLDFPPDQGCLRPPPAGPWWSDPGLLRAAVNGAAFPALLSSPIKTAATRTPLLLQGPDFPGSVLHCGLVGIVPAQGIGASRGNRWLSLGLASVSKSSRCRGAGADWISSPAARRARPSGSSPRRSNRRFSGCRPCPRSPSAPAGWCSPAGCRSC